MPFFLCKDMPDIIPRKTTFSIETRQVRRAVHFAGYGREFGHAPHFRKQKVHNDLPISMPSVAGKDLDPL